MRVLCVDDQLSTVTVIVVFAFGDGRRHVTHGKGVVVQWYWGDCSEMLLASMTSDLEKGGIDLLLGMFFENLRLVELCLRVLAYLFSIGEFLLCQFYLPLRLLPGLIREGLLGQGQPKLLARLFFKPGHRR